MYVESRAAEVVGPGDVGDDALPALPDVRQPHPHVPVPHLQGKETHHEENPKFIPNSLQAERFVHQRSKCGPMTCHNTRMSKEAPDLSDCIHFDTLHLDLQLKVRTKTSIQ